MSQLKKIKPIVCAGLALSAIEAMASTTSAWDLESLTSDNGVEKGKTIPKEEGHKNKMADKNNGQSIDSEEKDRLKALGEFMVNGPKASQTMAHSWYRLSERVHLGGQGLLDIYEKEGLGQFIKTQSNGSEGSGACYVACYGNCYGNCYSNCYGNCHSADA